MRLAGRVQAAPAAAVNAVRALRLLRAAERALDAGVATDEVLRTLARPATPARRRAPSPAAAAAAVRRVGALRARATCVPRAVAMAALLGPSDERVAVVLGARRRDGEWVAHAWVEVDGAPWLDLGGGFHRLAVYEARQGWALVGEGGRR